MNRTLPVNSRITRITCVQLSGEFPDFCHRLIMPDYGMPLIGTILSEAGYDVTVFMEHVSPPDWNEIARSDIVCMSMLSAGVDKTFQLADTIRTDLKIPVIFGGTHATYFPESCLKHCDYVVLGEGDETILALCNALSEGHDVSSIAGIAFEENGCPVITNAAPEVKHFDTIPDFTLIQGYKRLSFFEMFRTLRLPLLTVQATRGCPYSCSYCIVDKMFEGGYKTRSIESVIRDMRDKRQYGKQLLFVDNNFAAKPTYTKALLRRIIEEDFGFDIMVLTRIDIANNDELLGLMRQAGINRLYQGYESVQPETLRAYDKRQSVDKIRHAIDRFHSYGFHLSGSFVVGADTDTRETIHATVRFILDQKLEIGYIFPIWGHYREDKHDAASIVPWHRSIFKGWPYCDGNFVSHFPLLMRPSVLQRELISAHRTIFSRKTAMQALMQFDYRNVWKKLTHRWMWNTIEQALLEYIPWLEEIETGLYDSHDRLIESRLVERAQEPSWPVFPESVPKNSPNVPDAKSTPGIQSRKGCDILNSIP